MFLVCRASSFVLFAISVVWFTNSVVSFAFSSAPFWFRIDYRI
jgi:hypothetical protein